MPTDQEIMGTGNNTASSQATTTGSNDDENSSPPMPAPFNPMGGPTPHSVVGSLMEVYESLTNSQTTHEQYQHQHQQHGQQQYHYDQSAQANSYQQEHPHPSQQYQPVQMQHTHYNAMPQNGPQGYYQDSQAIPDCSPPLDQHPLSLSIPIPPQPDYYAYAMPPPATQPAEAAPTAASGRGHSVKLDGSVSSIKSQQKRSASARSEPQEEEKRPAPKRRGSNSSNSNNEKTRRKFKESDGRWSKRFTWPEALHRDFVSAIFDVGLKHSSPATILEHMPKHEQINSERVKSHLQKYRMHRAKSKKEFMTSYDLTYSKFKAPGGMDHVKTLTAGDAAAHLTLVTLTGEPDDSSTNKNRSSNRNAATSSAVQQGRAASQGQASSQHEALMLPKLTEAEKNSPIGASMGYLLGLFFSLKRQLLQQRAESATAVPPAAAAKNAPVVHSSDSQNGPVADVYNSFVHSQSNDSAFMVPQRTATGEFMEWSSAAAPVAAAAASGEGMGPPIAPSAAAVPITAGVPNPVVPPQCTGSTRTNLEASSMMKREMQNQMAFQNKMRALKQQELFKFKNVSDSPPSNEPGGSGGSDFRQTMEHDSFDGKSEGKAWSPPESNDHQGRDYSHAAAHEQHQHHSSEMDSQEHGQQQQQQQHNQNMQSQEQKASGNRGHAVTFDEIQGAGETAMPGSRARAPSMSLSAHDDFWNTDVVDEQLFEFLMDG